MDIQSVFESKIKALPTGLHVTGLRSVKAHIDAAVRHFMRGQEEADESLFTNVIFRCNQAFEGSLKEAYRVLAGKDPAKVKPYEIEKFFIESNLLRAKVLGQFTNYRQEWRNPSAHDYTLDFDEDEALIAIVSVTVFAIVLTDQIAGNLAFTSEVFADPGQALKYSEKNVPLLELVANRIHDFASRQVVKLNESGPTNVDYFRLEGALAGNLTLALSNFPDIQIEQNPIAMGREADIIVSRGGEKVVVEVKRASASTSIRPLIQRAVTQVAFFLNQPDVIGAVVLVYSMAGGKYENVSASEKLNNVVRVISPQIGA